MAELDPPPDALRGFPRRTLRAGVDLYRIHPRDLGPWWFSSDGLGRFDLGPPNGTCYLSLSPLGAFVEVFRRFTLVAAAEIAARARSRLHLPRDVVLADCTSGRARRLGMTAAVHSTSDYAVTHAWAAAFRDVGFHGVRYFCGHDPSQREVGIALFGDAGEAEWPVEDTSPVGDDVTHAVERRFGIHLLPAP